jgi:hypothetical protein
MKILNRSIPAILLFQVLWLSAAQSAELKLPREGWVSWQVPAIDDAPAWCCWDNRRGGNDSPKACALDNADGFGVGDHDTTTDAVKVYARIANGKVDRLQALSAGCPVETRTPVQELGEVIVDESVRWLVTQARQDDAQSTRHHSIVESALAALALHRGNLALDAMGQFSRDPRVEVRKWSVFWLAMVRGSEGADITSKVMFSDGDAEVRKHAGFAIAQTKSPRAAADLIRQGNTDKVGDVRAQAWFWLAQTGAADAEKAIQAALRKDDNEEVREQAIFALSQLPGDRAVKALIEVAQDQSLSREQRKRAVFWLSQSESDAAQAYLEKVLARNTP